MFLLLCFAILNDTSEAKMGQDGREIIFEHLEQEHVTIIHNFSFSPCVYITIAFALLY